MSVTVNEIDNYENYGRCVRISNGEIEVLVTVDVGPRIIRYAFVGGENVMFNDIERKSSHSGPEYDKHYYKGATWYIYGGHRLWASPESSPETYFPDNDKVDYKVIDGGAVFTPKPQTANGMQHMIELKMGEDGSVEVTHKIRNISEKEQEFAIWALTVMRKGGLEIIPQNTHNTGLLANRFVSVWPYADLTDDRFYFGKKYVTLRQNPESSTAFKIGFDNQNGYAVYINGENVFINKYKPNHPDGIYPDNGVSFETYTNGLILEMETLGELTKAAPGQELVHVENWSLKKNPGTPDARDEKQIEEFLNKVL